MNVAYQTNIFEILFRTRSTQCLAIVRSVGKAGGSLVDGKDSGSPVTQCQKAVAQKLQILSNKGLNRYILINQNSVCMSVTIKYCEQIICRSLF